MQHLNTPQAQLTALERILTEYPNANYYAIAVGNEVMHRRDLTQEAHIAIIRQVGGACAMLAARYTALCCRVAWMGTARWRGRRGTQHRDRYVHGSLLACAPCSLRPSTDQPLAQQPSFTGMLGGTCTGSMDQLSVRVQQSTHTHVARYQCMMHDMCLCCYVCSSFQVRVLVKKIAKAQGSSKLAAVPITTVDVPWSITAELAAELDVVAVNVHPFYGGLLDTTQKG